jgi:hypothetical protein
MVHLLVGLLLAGGVSAGPTIAPRTVAGKPTYRVTLRPDQRDYWLATPGPGSLAIVFAGACPSGKCKLVFATPLRAGRYDLEVHSRLPADPPQTFVFSVPVVPGTTTFLVTAREPARYDFAFHAGATREHRFTFSTPAVQRTLAVSVP